MKMSFAKTGSIVFSAVVVTQRTFADVCLLSGFARTFHLRHPPHYCSLPLENVGWECTRQGADERQSPGERRSVARERCERPARQSTRDAPLTPRAANDTIGRSVVTDVCLQIEKTFHHF